MAHCLKNSYREITPQFAEGSILYVANFRTPYVPRRVQSSDLSLREVQPGGGRLGAALSDAGRPRALPCPRARGLPLRASEIVKTHDFSLVESPDGLEMIRIIVGHA